MLKNRDIHPCFFQLKHSDNNTVVAKNDEFINVLNRRLRTTSSREDISPMRWSERFIFVFLNYQPISYFVPEISSRFNILIAFLAGYDVFVALHTTRPDPTSFGRKSRSFYIQPLISSDTFSIILVATFHRFRQRC